MPSRLKRFIHYKQYCKVLSKYFAENYRSGGVKDTSALGEAYEDIVKIPDNNTENKRLLRKANRKDKTGEINRRKYQVLEKGNIHVLIDHEKKYTVLKADDYNSIFLGESKIRNTSRPQKFRKVNWRCAMMYYSYKGILDSYGIDIDKCVIIEGCYWTNLHTLQRTMTPEVTGSFSKYPSKDNMAELDSSVWRIFKKLKMYGQIPTPKIDDMLETLIGSEKKPGFRYEECFKQSTKAEAISSAMAVAFRRWKYLENTPINEIKHEKIFSGVYTIGARNKRDYTYDDGELAVSRAVHMPELHVELTSAPWCDKATERIIEVGRGPIYIGNSILKSERMKKDLAKSTFVLEGDFKRFDSTLYLRIITCALSMLRCLYDLNDSSIDRHFLGIYDSLAIKDYYVTRGKVYRIFHGIPSGVKSTSLLGSLINLICLVYAVGPKASKFFNFIIGGDDFLIAHNGEFDFKSNKVAAKVERRVKKLGMLLKFLKVKYYNSESLDDCPTFYKYTIYKDYALTPNEAMLERVFMPWNKKYDTGKKMLDFLWDVMPSLGRPMSNLYLYYVFLQRTIYNEEGRFVSIRSLVKKHLMIYNKMELSKDRENFKYFNADEEADKISSAAALLTYNRTKIKRKFKFNIESFT